MYFMEDLYTDFGNVEAQVVKRNDRNFNTDIKISDPKSINYGFQLQLKREREREANY